uniref:Leptin n=1 Tax=Anolis carolinensis TaxID=28377 RepID=A0A803TRC9_ANOCA|nr:PREDICTED: leptin [Anolis carolinensis]|eukprot:XP_003229128.2 PREDICTED: leptin [Anolis carolinensis]
MLSSSPKCPLTALPLCLPGAQATMRCLSLSLCGFLWAWLPLLHGQSLKVDKTLADTKMLVRTIISRIQEQGFSPLSTKFPGLDFIPEELQGETLQDMYNTLGVFQQVIASLPAEASVIQIGYDVENLQSLLWLLGAYQNCPIEKGHSGEDMSNLTELLTIPPYTLSVVTLGRLQNCLQQINSLLNSLLMC